MKNSTNAQNKLILLLVMMFIAIEGIHAQNYSARIYGKVVDTTNIPVEGASVVVLEHPTLGSSTTESGRYELAVPHGKEITIEVRCVGYLPQQKKITIDAGKRTQLNFELTTNAIDLQPVQITSGRDAFEIMEKFNPKIIHHIPTTKSSVEDLVVLKGFARRNNDLTSQYNVRGGNYDENLIYLNDMEIYRPFLIRSGQQEGLSFINPDLVSVVNFSSGGFDAVYGDKMSSVLDVHYKKPAQFAASLSASLLGAAGHLEGATKDGKMSALLGVRYQSNGYVFRQMQTKGLYRPTFTDVQLLLNHHKPGSKWEFSLFGNFARNVYWFIPDSISEMNGTVEGMKKLTGYFEGQEVDAFQSVFASFITKYRVTDSTNLKLIFSYFNTTEKETFDITGQYFIGDVILSLGDTSRGETINNRDVGGDTHHGRNFLNAHIFHGELRGEHRLKKSRLEWGVKGQGEFVNDRLSEWRLLDSAGYSLPAIPTIPSDSIGVPFEHPSRLIYMKGSYLKKNNNPQTFRSEGFLQNRWSFGDPIRIVLVGGVRYSYWSFNNELLITPRARLVFQPKPKFAYYLATGLYYQPAFYKEMRMEDGNLNTDIKAQKSYHVIAGMNYSFEIYRRPFKFSTEVYYKYLWDLTTYSIDNVRIIYSGKNDADGYSVGIDAKLSGEIVANLESWITLSLMKTQERIDGGAYNPRPTDQRFSLHAFVQDKIPTLPMFKAHISIFYSSSLPYCYPNSRIYTGKYGKDYFRTDIGFSWQFIDAATHIGKKTLKVLNAGYLTFEITNLFNYSNILSYSWILVQDDGGQNGYFRISNRLPPRLFNVKLRLEF